jgi:serine phosphatase RsbU (regulator of sigma subunit)
MKFILSCIILFFSVLILDAQTVTIISDGNYGFDYSFEKDTLLLTSFGAGENARNSGLHPGDKIIYVNGNKVSGSGLTEEELLAYIKGSVGSEMKLQILRKEIDSLLTFNIILDSYEEPWNDCYYDYLAGPFPAKITLKTISDLNKITFSSLAKEGTKIYSVTQDTAKGILDLKPGDELISFYNDYYSWTKLAFREFEDRDTIIKIQRDSTVFYLHIDLRKYSKLKTNTVLSNDLKAESILLRIILTKRLNEDKSFYLRFYEWYDTIILYQKSSFGTLVEKKTGTDLAKNIRNSFFKDCPVIRLNLRKEGTDTMYIKVTKTGGIIYPPNTDFLTMDYVNEFEKTERLVLGSLIGMMLVIALYYFIMYLVLKESSYLIFLFFIIGLSFYLFHMSGYGPQFMWTGSIKFFDKISILFKVIPVTFFLIFSSLHLDLLKEFRRWIKIGTYILIGVWILTLIMLIDSFIHTSPDTGYIREQCQGFIIVFLIVLGLMTLYLAFRRIKQNYRPAKGFLLGIGIFAISIILFLYYPRVTEFFSTRFNLSADVMTIFIRPSIFIGAIFQFLIFSVALGNKMRDDNIQIKASQQKIIEQLRENELLKDKVNLELEMKVNERTREIEQQKNILQEQKQEITDSINYAKRIQTAVLPTKEILEEVLPEHFVLFKPRDIVSGDFYWMRKIKNFTVVVAADCTGHGVPGAFMSMLGVSLLNELVSKSRFDKAGEILDRLRKKIKETLKQEGRSLEQKDGMDMGLAIINNDTMDLQFAGAFNPMYIVRKKDKSLSDKSIDLPCLESESNYLIEIKGDRQPVSIHYSEKDFTTHEIKLQPEDTIYLFSDGYMDQFGGPSGKKFLYQNFKKLLLNIQENDMDKQKVILEDTLKTWQGENPQVDDIMIIGIRWK